MTGIKHGYPRLGRKIQFQCNSYGKKKVELLTYFILSGLVIPSGPSIKKIEPLWLLEGALDKTVEHVTGMIVCSRCIWTVVL